MIDFEALAAAMGELDEDTVKELLEAVMAEGGADANKAMDACQKGMDTVGKLFEEGEYFVGDLIYAGELMTDAVEILKDALGSGDAAGPKTRMILCTVKDDLHDIGKNIVRSMLEANGFEVLDLGIDCPAEKVVQTAKAEGIKIVALSGVLTLALDSMKATVDAIKAAGLDCKVIIGGAPVSAEACRNIGADEWAHSPQKTVATCKAWAENKKTASVFTNRGGTLFTGCRSVLPGPILHAGSVQSNDAQHQAQLGNGVYALFHPVDPALCGVLAGHIAHGHGTDKGKDEQDHHKTLLHLCRQNA